MCVVSRQICVPKFSVSKNLKFTISDYETHILITTEEGGEKFTTLNDKVIFPLLLKVKLHFSSISLDNPRNSCHAAIAGLIEG